MKIEEPFCVKRIRLINFHNFSDEIITIPDHGHLFLLGDNGCGKTTVLDAIHYALTAGRSMEWNSAARVTGRKDGGRRLQGVVLRYNIETGVMNKDGSITYVALEIVGRHGKLLTIGLGLSTMSMDEKVNVWGVIRECSLDEVPFLISDEQGKRPATRREFKKGLGRGFYGNVSNYRQELARRLFGGEDSYQEICRFLRMGKAYREIAAGAADYHELFKQLLPEPTTSIFEQIIDGLRTLDSSKLLLDDFQRKVNYVRSLQDIVTGIGKQQEAICRYKWLRCRWSINKNQKQQDAAHLVLQRLQEELLCAEKEREILRHQEDQLQERLTDLKTKDVSGLVRQEKSCKSELEEKNAKRASHRFQLKEKQKQLRQAGRELQQDQTYLTTLLGKVMSECGRKARSLPFSITSFQEETDRLFRDVDIELCQTFTGEMMLNDVAEHRQKLHDQAVLLGATVEESRQTCDDLQERLQGLEKREMAQPHQEITPCIHALQVKMITPKPLYLGLEWLPGLERAMQGRIEEAIGEAILATLIVRETDYQTCRHLMTDWSGLRISCASHWLDELPEWMSQVFDIRRSDPEALRCLATEMESRRSPSVSRLNGKDILSFRSHERTLAGHPARLIGAESRRQALMVEVEKCAAELSHCKKTWQKKEKEQAGLVRQQTLLKRFHETIEALLRDINKQTHKVIHAKKMLALAREYHAESEHTYGELQREVDGLVLRVKELKALISKEGLEGLDRRITSLQGKLQKKREAFTKQVALIGGLSQELKQNKIRTDDLVRDARILHNEFSHKTKSLAKRLPDIDDVEHYVLRVKTGGQFTSSEAIDKKCQDAERSAMRLVVELKGVKLQDPEFEAGFRFTYDAELNEVRDFRALPLSVILPEQEKTMEEQQELLGEHTRKLFKKIIMGDLMSYLRGHVSGLKQMIKLINSRLSKRSFGGQRYQFRVTPLPEFRRLVDIVKNYSSFDPDADNEVIHFFEDHREDLMAAEIGAVPDELDYRNWYRYELEVSSPSVSDDGQGVVIDRTTKSMGSGGEQAVPNYLLILTIAHFLYQGKKVHLHTLLFDEAFYGIDAGRRDQLLGFASDLNLQLFVASPDQDGVRREISHSTTLFVVKDKEFDVHLRDFHWQNPNVAKPLNLFVKADAEKPIEFGEEL